MRLGLLVLLGGMLVVLFLCVRRWDQGPIYRYMPPAYGLVAGIVFAILWRTPTTSMTTSLETVAAFTVAGWIFWIAVWAEKRERSD